MKAVSLSYLDDKRLREYIRLVDGIELPNLYKHYLDGADGTGCEDAGV